jgi:hypothetical protein
VAYSGWDLLDSFLEALPLGIVVFTFGLLALAINPAVISWTIVFALSGIITSVEFAYNMNQLLNPRLQKAV